jgi:GNAT superfamily N-acetyltransferase
MIEQLNFNDFDKIYEIMEKSFPLTEFRLKHEQAELFHNKYYRIFGIKENEIITSIAAVWCFEDFVFIEHLATLPEHRNKGLGAQILNKILNTTDKLVCLEVEPPEDELTRKRVAFYKRNGMFFNSYPYIQPSISSGRAPIPLYIMTSKSQIDEKTFEKIKSVLYKQVYKIM